MVAGIITAIAAVIAAVVGGVSAGVNYNQQKDAAATQQQQFNAQQAQLASATRTKVADLKASGLSPVLAAGNAAQVATPPTPIVPQFDQSGSLSRSLSDLSKSPESIMNMVKQHQDISMSKSQQELLKSQERVNNATVINKLADARKAGISADEIKRNMELATTTGLRTDKPDMASNMVNNLWNLFNTAVGESRGRDLKEKEKNSKGASGGW